MNFVYGFSLLLAVGFGALGMHFYHRVLIYRLWLDVALRSLARYLREAWAIGRHALVVDIGSGDRPHLRADVLCDRYELSAERSAPLLRDRPLVIGDITALPFKTGTVDTVICQHVIEHIAQPEAALAEMQRIGRNGIIRTPSPFAEKLCSRDVHRWIVSTEKEAEIQRLVLQQKQTPYWDRELNRMLAENLDFWFFFGRQLDSMETTYHWDQTIHYRVDRFPDAPWDGCAHESTTPAEAQPSQWDRFRLRQIASRYLGRFYRYLLLGRPRAFDWEQILACPVCKGPVKVTTDVHCPACRLHYPLRDGVPIMISSEAQME